MALGADGAYRHVGSSEAQGFSTVSTQGTLPSGETPVKEATSEVSPTMLMPGSPSWNLVAPGSGGTDTLVEVKLEGYILDWQLQLTV